MQICDPRRCIPNAFPTAGAYGSLSLLIQCRSTAAGKCFGEVSNIQTDSGKSRICLMYRIDGNFLNQFIAAISWF